MLDRLLWGITSGDPRSHMVVKYDPRDQCYGQGVAWVIGTGLTAICFIGKTPVLSWRNLDGLYRLGLHFGMVGGDDE